MKLVGTLLAAGLSSRFEGTTSKLVAPFRGSTIIGHSLREFRESGIEERSVVVGIAAFNSIEMDKETVLFNYKPERGLASSLGVALDWANSLLADEIVIGLADQPLIGSHAWRMVANYQGKPIVVATYEGLRRNPVKLKKEIFHLIGREGDRGASALYRLYPELVDEVAVSGTPIDIDTLEDLHKWNC